MKNLIAVCCAIAWIVTGARSEDMWTIEGQVFVRTKGAETIKLSLVDVQLFDAKAISEDVEKKRKAAEPIYESLQPILKMAEGKETDAKKERDRARKVEYDILLNKSAISRKAILPYVEEGTELWRTLTEMKGTKALGNVEADQIKTAVAEAVTRREEAWRVAAGVVSEITGKVGYLSSALYYFKDLPEPIQTTKSDADGKFSFKAPSGSYVLAAVSRRQTGKETEFYHWMVKLKVDADKKVMLANDNLSSSGSTDSLINALDNDPLYERITLNTIAAFVENDRRERASAEVARQ